MNVNRATTLLLQIFWTPNAWFSVSLLVEPSDLQQTVRSSWHSFSVSGPCHSSLHAWGRRRESFAINFFFCGDRLYGHSFSFSSSSSSLGRRETDGRGQKQGADGRLSHASASLLPSVLRHCDNDLSATGVPAASSVIPRSNHRVLLR
jgi:hypothetical protein